MPSLVPSLHSVLGRVAHFLCLDNCNKLLAVKQQPEVGVKAQEKECEGNTAEWHEAQSKW